jgi:hypothetical protein
MNGQSLGSSYASALRTSFVVLVLVLAACLSLLLPPRVVLVPLAGAALLWVAFQSPMLTLGAVLAFMPFEFMAIALGKFGGLPHMTLVSVLEKEVLLALLAFMLWRRNGFKPAAPDWFLLAFLMLALVRTAFSGSLVTLALDLNFMIPYAVGRMVVFAPGQESLWARRAVWIMAILAVLGLAEVFIFGEGPRTVLYLAIDSETEGAQLSSSFHAVGFSTLRESATMVGPNGFGALCMVALIIWWVYCRNPLPAGMIAAGLICSITRSAWLGAAVAIPVLAFRMGQKKRLYLYTGLAFALFLASIPVLGLGDYLFYNKTGQDPSAEYHRNQILTGVQYVADHPFGSGNEKLSPIAAHRIDSDVIFETTYPALAAEYGIPATLCFVSFLFTALYVVWRNPSQLGYAASGILLAICVVMVFTIPTVDRRLSPWVWFPIGLAIRSAVRRDIPLVPPVRTLVT